MKKNDLLILVALFALWMAWPQLYSVISPPVPEDDAPAALSQTDLPDEEASLSAAPAEPAGELPVAGEPAAVEAVADDTAENLPEETIFLSNDRVDLTFSSRGGSLIDAVLKEYKAENTDDSPPVRLNFENMPAAVYQGLAGFTVTDGFERVASSDNHVVFERTSGAITLRRQYTLTDAYSLILSDTFMNQSDSALEIPAMALQTGVFMDNPAESITPGLLSLGVDTLASNDEKVKHSAKSIAKEFKGKSGWAQVHLDGGPLDWVAAKNKYFVQILSPEDGGQVASAFGQWDAETKRLAAIGGRIHFDPFTLQPGVGYTRTTALYTGPKKLSLLENLHNHKDGIMQLGWWFLPWIGGKLLWMINGIQGVIGSYGLAIMIVTLIMRILFWPLTHKGTESMRRMSELSPQMKELSEKYKDNPQKKQEALMAFYKENKINPLGGCFPMLVQIPIFLSLFYVLKSAIELRFAPFLWISDLSEPDHFLHLGFALPILGEYINLLPFLMSISMYLQQKVAPMTPATATDDAQQQIQRTMMRMMPIMMFFVLYNFAAGLALYWTTQNCLMVVQHLVYKKRKQIKAAQEDEA